MPGRLCKGVLCCQVSPAHVRGALGSVSQLVVCIGILVALLVNVALPATSWRTMFGLATIPAIILALGAPCLSRLPWACRPACRVQ